MDFQDENLFLNGVDAGLFEGAGRACGEGGCWSYEVNCLSQSRPDSPHVLVGLAVGVDAGLMVCTVCHSRRPDAPHVLLVGSRHMLSLRNGSSHQALPPHTGTFVFHHHHCVHSSA